MLKRIIGAVRGGSTEAKADSVQLITEPSAGKQAYEKALSFLPLMQTASINDPQARANAAEIPELLKKAMKEKYAKAHALYAVLLVTNMQASGDTFSALAATNKLQKDIARQAIEHIKTYLKTEYHFHMVRFLALLTVGDKKAYREVFAVLKNGVKKGEVGARYCMAALIALAEKIQYSAEAANKENALFFPMAGVHMRESEQVMPFYKLLTYPAVLKELKDVFAKQFTRDVMQQMHDNYEQDKPQGSEFGVPNVLGTVVLYHFIKEHLAAVKAVEKTSVSKVAEKMKFSPAAKLDDVHVEVVEQKEEAEESTEEASLLANDQALLSDANEGSVSNIKNNRGGK